MWSIVLLCDARSVFLELGLLIRSDSLNSRGIKPTLLVPEVSFESMSMHVRALAVLFWVSWVPLALRFSAKNEVPSCELFLMSFSSRR